MRRNIVLWLDENCYNQENTQFFNQLRQLSVKVKRFDKLIALQDQLETISEGISSTFSTFSIVLLCSSTLNSNIYEKLCQDPKISMVIIYCRRQIRGLELQQKFQKIERTFTSDTLLAEFLRNQYSEGPKLLRSDEKLQQNRDKQITLI